MSECYVKLKEVIEYTTDPIESVKLTLSVTEAVGVTAALFVHQYFPKSPYSGTNELSFYNVAYPDELSDISDKLTNPRNACYIRTSSTTKLFKSYADMESFLDTVKSDLSRLLRYLQHFDTGSTVIANSVTVTPTGHYSTPISTSYECCEAVEGGDTGGVVCQDTTTTYDLNDGKTETIIVDITGK